MDHRCKVTVGLCVKNVERTIEQALKSILEQDYSHALMELIVVDGYSSDRTLSIIKRNLLNADLRCKIFCENKGLGMARQIVVNNANGDYIVWVDGDMILPKDYISKQVEFMEENPKVAIGRAKYGIIPSEGIVAFFENLPFVIECSKHRVGDDISIDISGTSGSICRVEALKQVGGFDVEIRGAGEDVNIAYKIKSVGWLICLTPATFFPICRRTWKELWDEYFWWGYGAHYNFHKIRSIVKLYRMTPLAGFLAGVLRLPQALKIKRQKLIFLLPIHYAFKRTAWCLGFLKSQFDGYGHDHIL